MDNMNSSSFPGISEPNQEFDWEKYLNSLGIVINDEHQSACIQICNLPPASDLIDIYQQYKIQDGAIIRCSPWINEQLWPFPFFWNDSRFQKEGAKSAVSFNFVQSISISKVH